MSYNTVPPAVPQRVASNNPPTTVTIDDLDSENSTPTSTSAHVPTFPLTILPGPPLPHTELNTTYSAWSADPPTPTLAPPTLSRSTNPDRTEFLTQRLADLQSELTSALAYRSANPT